MNARRAKTWRSQGLVHDSRARRAKPKAEVMRTAIDYETGGGGTYREVGFASCPKQGPGENAPDY